MICQVERGEAQVEILPEGFADGNIKRCVRGQMGRTIAVEKAGAIVDVEVRRRTPGQPQIEAGRERVALVVIEEEVALVRRLEIGEAAADRAGALGVLVRVSKVEAREVGDRGRFGAGFPAANAGAGDGQREKDVGVP
jgi:hypothetical protein